MRTLAVWVAGTLLILSSVRIALGDSRDLHMNASQSHLGDVGGTLTYDPGAAGDNQGTLIVHLMNALDASQFAKGFITTIAFDAHGDVSGSFHDADDPDTTDFDESNFKDLPPVQARAFGAADNGQGLGCIYVGGLEPAEKGIGIGRAGTVSFDISGPSADALSADDIELFVRFRGVDQAETEADDNLSDRLTTNANPTLPWALGSPVPIPLPPAAWSGLALLGATGLGKLTLKLRRR